MRTLNTYVHVDGVWYRPGTVPPPEVAKRITNPDVWDGEPEQSAAEPVQPPAPAKVPDTTGSSGGNLPEPPRAGKGSGTDAWLAYAKDHGIEVPADAGRDDIVALVDARKEG
jgi:hypothetical protein